MMAAVTDQLWSPSKLLDEWGVVDTIIKLFKHISTVASFFALSVIEVTFSHWLPVYRRLHMKTNYLLRCKKGW